VEFDTFQHSSVLGLAGSIMLPNLSLQSFVGGADFCDGSDHQLRGKIELCSYPGISNLLQIILEKGLILKGDFREAIASLLIPLGGISQELIGVWVGLEFEFEDQFHTLIIPDNRPFFKIKIGEYGKI
jgi:hypothetical protein